MKEPLEMIAAPKDGGFSIPFIRVSGKCAIMTAQFDPLFSLFICTIGCFKQLCLTGFKPKDSICVSRPTVVTFVFSTHGAPHIPAAPQAAFNLGLGS